MLHSNRRVLLYYYCIDVTPVTGKNILFFTQRHLLDVFIYTFVSIRQSHLKFLTYVARKISEQIL
jgi:hypothetical protein